MDIVEAQMMNHLLAEILKELDAIRRLLTPSPERDPWAMPNFLNPPTPPSWPDEAQMRMFGVEIATGLVHRVCPVTADCEGYETTRADAIGPMIWHLRERHAEWYEKFARQAAHDNGQD